MPKVILKKSSYNYEELKPQIFELLESIDSGHIRKNSRVLIKPNLLAPAPPESAILTHPLIIRASAEYVLAKGAVPQISDSPGSGAFDKVIMESGIKKALNGLNIDCTEFRRSVPFDIGPPFNKIEIAEDAVNADVIINLPKLKTHTQMLLTLGVKNLFGCIVGMRKPEWHFRTGVDREMFAGLLVRIYKALRPSLTIIDGILAMEGAGPGRSGIPKHLGLLMGGSDAVALDITVCELLGIDPDRLFTNKAARAAGFVSEEIEKEGDFPVIKDFRLPETVPVIFGPRKLHGFMRRHLVQRPVPDDKICRLCGECLRYCHAKAITVTKNGISFDYDRCIRCYCCIEFCPYGALSARETFYGGIIRKILWRRHH